LPLNEKRLVFTLLTNLEVMSRAAALKRGCFVVFLESLVNK
jgi:hypothetical protein